MRRPFVLAPPGLPRPREYGHRSAHGSAPVAVTCSCKDLRPARLLPNHLPASPRWIRRYVSSVPLTCLRVLVVSVRLMVSSWIGIRSPMILPPGRPNWSMFCFAGDAVGETVAQVVPLWFRSTSGEHCNWLVQMAMGDVLVVHVECRTRCRVRPVPVSGNPATDHARITGCMAT